MVSIIRAACYLMAIVGCATIIVATYLYGAWLVASWVM